MCDHGTDLSSENIPRDLTNTATGRAYRTKHTTPQWNHHSTVTTIW